jgi:hypothetical protein
MEPGDNRSEDERRLWASLALEQLAKWALALTSPTLVADPVNAGGEQLLKALGLRDGGPYVSVTASTAFKRCAAVYKPFSESDALKFSGARNEYLHGTEIAVLKTPFDAWWSRFWSLMNVLLVAHQLTMEDLVGGARLAEVEAHLARNAKRITHQYEAAIEAARRNLGRYNDHQMLADEAARWERADDGRYMWTYADSADCPACGALGVLEADDADDKEVHWPEDPDDYPSVDAVFTPEHFACPRCHLSLDGWELLAEAGLADQVRVATDESPYEDSEYGND